MAVSESTLLNAASASVSATIERLRAEAEQLRQQYTSAASQARQLQRSLDELSVQRAFAEQLNAPNLARIQQQEAHVIKQLQAVEALATNGGAALKRLDQFIRQLEMSSTILTGATHSVDSDDPWMLALRGQIIHGREEERVRLAREVHDGPAQVLANVLMGLEHAINLERSTSEQLRDFLPELRDAARTGLREIRTFIADLRPGALDQGLAMALTEYIRSYERTTGVQVTLDMHSWSDKLAKEAEIVVYRVVQEALQNVNKYARQAQVTIRSTYLNSWLTLVIRDNGPGFDPREVARRTGKESWGLTSMRERVALVGGQFAIASRPGLGTEVTIKVPT